MIKTAKIEFLADNAFPFEVIGNHVEPRVWSRKTPPDQVLTPNKRANTIFD